MIRPQDITGVVLAGGRGSRMGGVDKGLQQHLGVPMALHALRRLSPQVGQSMINANRNLETYRSMGVPVWPDSVPDYAGPLAGFLTGLEHCSTAYMLTVPCDSPFYPSDLAKRLGDALVNDEAEVAVVATRDSSGHLQVQPVFCLIKTSLLDSLRHCIENGERKIDQWTSEQHRVVVAFDDARAFVNANTLDELHALQQHD
jgi:molybdenum cofactor guanylyltransferase